MRVKITREQAQEIARKIEQNYELNGVSKFNLAQRLIEKREKVLIRMGGLVGEIADIAEANKKSGELYSFMGLSIFDYPEYMENLDRHQKDFFSDTYRKLKALLCSPHWEVVEIEGDDLTFLIEESSREYRVQDHEGLLYSAGEIENYKKVLRKMRRWRDKEMMKTKAEPLKPREVIAGGDCDHSLWKCVVFMAAFIVFVVLLAHLVWG